MAARSEAWIFFARSDTGIVGSNPTWSMVVCVRLFCVCAVLCVDSGIVTSWSPAQGVLPTVYRITKLKKRLGPDKGLQRLMNEMQEQWQMNVQRRRHGSLVAEKRSRPSWILRPVLVPFCPPQTPHRQSWIDTGDNYLSSTSVKWVYLIYYHERQKSNGEWDVGIVTFVRALLFMLFNRDFSLFYSQHTLQISHNSRQPGFLSHAWTLIIASWPCAGAVMTFPGPAGRWEQIVRRSSHVVCRCQLLVVIRVWWVSGYGSAVVRRALDSKTRNMPQ
jgi:hypothetical protein